MYPDDLKYSTEHEWVRMDDNVAEIGVTVFAQDSLGDVVFVEPNVLHQFVNSGDEPFKFLCLVPVTHDCGKPTPGSG